MKYYSSILNDNYPKWLQDYYFLTMNLKLPLTKNKINNINKNKNMMFYLPHYVIDISKFKFLSLNLS